MTTNIAYRDPKTGECWIGADSRTVQGGNFIYPSTIGKWVQYGDWWIAVSGSLRTIQLLREHMAELTRADSVSRIAVIFIGLLVEDKYVQALEETAGPRYFDEVLAVVGPGGVWEVTGSGTILSPDDGFVATGSGQEYAYGAAAALFEMGVSNPETIVGGALRAAAKYDVGTGGKLVVRPAR